MTLVSFSCKHFLLSLGRFARRAKSEDAAVPSFSTLVDLTKKLGGEGVHTNNYAIDAEFVTVSATILTVSFLFHLTSIFALTTLDCEDLLAFWLTDYPWEFGLLEMFSIVLVSLNALFLVEVALPKRQQIPYLVRSLQFGLAWVSLFICGLHWAYFSPTSHPRFIQSVYERLLDGEYIPPEGMRKGCGIHKRYPQY